MFKNSNGVRLLKGLFFEKTLQENRHLAVYTLKHEDHTVEETTYPSLYRLYMECEDPTEWSFATAHLDGWQHWKQLCECNWFKPIIEEWREELSLKIASKLVKNMISISKTNSREAASANKYLLDKGYFKTGDKSTNKVGRPSKEQINKEIKRQAQKDQDLEADLKRLNLH